MIRVTEAEFRSDPIDTTVRLRAAIRERAAQFIVPSARTTMGSLVIDRALAIHAHAEYVG